MKGQMLRQGLLSFTLLWLVFLPGDGAAELMGKKGRIQGDSFVNLRSGPGLSHPPRAVLRKGEEVTVERKEGGWYLVSLTDGKRGYVYEEFVHLFEEEVPREVPKEAPRENTFTEPSEEAEKDLQVLLTPEVERQTPKGRPLTIIKLLEGKEWKILSWFGMALCIFIIGWICGGNYYLRRDRINRTKLHF